MSQKRSRDAEPWPGQVEQLADQFVKACHDHPGLLEFGDDPRCAGTVPTTELQEVPSIAADRLGVPRGSEP